MTADRPLHVAIVGGGLCGIALGIALNRRNIPFTLYESRVSFTEIGAGINLNPAAIKALRIIHPSLAEKVERLTTRNPPPHEDTWMVLRYAAPSATHADGELLHEFESPSIGNMSLHRQELLSTLAQEMGTEHAKFNKSLASYEQGQDSVKLRFRDGTEAEASILIGCDGIHSQVRATMLGADNPATKPIFDHSGVYRAVIPMEKAVEALGDSARCSTITIGPGSYAISYPVNGGTALNCGLWLQLPAQSWKHPEWTLPNQGSEFRDNFKGWGERIHTLMDLFGPNPSLWASFQHTVQPERFTDGRVILIGDSAHSMPPHLGSGAATAVEDACVLAEVLACVNLKDNSSITATAALQAVEQVRKPRFLKVQEYSSQAGPRWFAIFNQKLEEDELAEWIRETERRLRWIWDIDLANQAEEAKALFQQSKAA